MEPMVTSAIISAGGQLLGNIMGGSTQSYNKQAKYMSDLQVNASNRITEFNARKQMEMWNKTNYEAQVKQMKQAGLNPGLLYSKGGTGGTTQVNAGNASMPSPIYTGLNKSKGMELGMALAERILTMKNLESNTNLNNANARESNVNANKKEGVDTQEALSRIDLNKIKLSYEQGNIVNALKLTEQEVNLKMAETRKLLAEGTLSEIDAQTRSWKNIEDVFNVIADTARMNEGIKQKWKEISIAQQNANTNAKNADTGYYNYLVNQRNTLIKEFEANLKAEYPNTSSMMGRLLNDFIGLSELELERNRGLLHRNIGNNTNGDW